ncbi:MAG TPA: hypothetical protein VH560_18065 [Polyangia bacterium]|jgi:hypothetical protein|nr:hypothetical protein [Polyangia bacterium]
MTRPPSSRALAPRRTRASRVAGWLGLLGFVWAAVALPAAHAVQHVREAAADNAAEARAEDVHALLRALIHGGARTPIHGHHHTHDGTPGAPDSGHGRGSAQHFEVALLGVEAPRVPPPSRRFVTRDAPPPIDVPAAEPTRSARTTRGPPAPAAT